MKVHKDILSKKERLELLKFVKTKTKNLGPNYPGLQSLPNLHEFKQLKTFLDKIKPFMKGYIIKKCWVNFSYGDFICWHNHPDCDKSMVYYLKNKSNLGTMFKKEGCKVEIKKGLENSLSIFDANLIHAIPPYLPEERYSIAIDLIKK
jgi:hypothetical protein